jgi:hypothetical protein
MTHTHDRTLLSRFGFSDPDKKADRHRLACRYMTRPEVLKSLVRVPSEATMRAEQEYLISKGRAQFTQHIGFADVLLFVDHKDYRSSGVILIEVKIQPVSVSEIIQQMRLYAHYLEIAGTSVDLSIAVVDFDMLDEDQDTLKAADITSVRLGSGFESWLKTLGTKNPMQAI